MPIVELEALARRRGLYGLELVAGDLAHARSAAGIYVEAASLLGSERTARASAMLDAPVIAACGLVPPSAIAELDGLYASVGGRLCVTHGTDAEQAAALGDAIASARSAHVRTAWEVRPRAEELHDAAAVLLVASETLAYVRLRGGGPELASHDGAGLGELLRTLALSRYSGPFALVPSTDDLVPSWERWLTRTGKTGCGSARDDADMHLDMRPVEPRDRLETILGAYRALAPGRTLHLTLDHDPSCMYFTLEATEPEGSFVFQRVAEGPTFWSVEVRKRERGAA